MESVIDTPREELAPTVSHHEGEDRPREDRCVDWPGGKHIRGITESSGAQVDIDEDGTVSIYATDAASMESAYHK